MPNRKKLLQDFYAKYAPNEVLTDKRLAAIESKYKDNDKQLLLDFYAKYAPDQELTDERYNAITVKYGLGKQPASPLGNGGASSSGQSQQPVTPTQPSGQGNKIKDLTIKATEAKAKGDEATFNAIKAQIDALNKPQEPQEPQEPMDLRKVDVSMPTEQRVAPPVVPNVENVNAQIYSNIAPNAKESMNLAELQKRYDKEVSRVPEGTTSPDLIGIKNEIENKYSMLESDYLAFLQSTNQGKYENYSQRLNTIKEKGEKTTDDMRFLESFRSEAINARLEADRYKIDKIKQTADLGTYQKQNELIKAEANKLEAQYKSYFNPDGTPKSPADAQKANEIANRINALGERQTQLKESTGVTDEVLTELGQAYDGIAQADILNKGWKPYSEIVGEETLQKEEERIRKDIAENGNMVQKSALMIMSFMDTVGSGVVAMGETPKVVADMFGYGGENGWTDALYDFSVDLNNKAAGRLKPLDTDSSLMNLADVFAKGAGNVVQLAAGSEVSGLAKAGSKIAQNAGIVASAFLMSEGQNYREALAAGISPEDAALYATMLSAAQAMTETIVPDFKYFDSSARKSILQAISNKTGVKEAFKQYGKQLMVDVPKTGVKEVGEELFTEVTGDAIKEGINAYRDQEIYKDTFNPDNYKEVALTAFVTGGGLASLKRGVRELTPNEEVVPRQVGENADKIIENIVTTDPELGVKVGEEVLSLKEIVTGLQGIPSYQNLGDREKDFVVNKLMQKQDLEKSMKLAGVKDEATMKEIEKIESDINAVYSGKKIGEEYTIEDAPETLSVGDTVVFGKPEQNIETVTEVSPEPAQELQPVAEDATASVGEVIAPDAFSPQEVQTESTQEGVKEEEVEEIVPDKVQEVVEVDALKDVESTAKAFVENGIPTEVVKEGFTDGKDLNAVFAATKTKYGEKEGAKYNDAANRLVNPNENNIIEVRSNGVVVKENGKYMFKPFTNTDANYKKWQLGKPMNITNQYASKVAEAYHAAKADGTNPELVQAVEDLLGKPNTLQEGGESQGIGLQEPLSENAQSVEQKETPNVEVVEQVEAVAPETLSKFEQAVKLYDQIQDAESGAKKRGVAEKRRAFMEANPTIKRIDDNISKIYKQLSDSGIITKKGKCP